MQQIISKENKTFVCVEKSVPSFSNIRQKKNVWSNSTGSFC